MSAAHNVAADDSLVEAMVSEWQRLDITATSTESQWALHAVLIDAIGVGLAGASVPAVRGTVEAAASLFGEGGPCTVLGWSEGLHPAGAAFANGALVHALNYDAMGPRASHVAVAAIPAVLAEAEARGVSGVALLDGILASVQITCALSEARNQIANTEQIRFGWMEGQLFAYFGAAAGVAKICGFDSEALVSMFGLGLMQAAGTMEVMAGGEVPAKAIYGAFPNLAAIASAALVERGMRAPIAALSGKYGLFPQFFGSGAPDAAAGSWPDYVSQLMFKPWPCTGLADPFIEAAQDIVRTTELSPDDIEGIVVLAPDQLSDWIEPLEGRRAPASAAAASDSIPYLVACALAHGDVRIDDVVSAGNGSDVESLAAKVEWEKSDRPGLRIRDADGRFIEREATSIARGTPRRPPDEHAMRAKFHKCAVHAQLSTGAESRLLDALSHCQELPSVSAITEIIRGAGRYRFERG